MECWEIGVSKIKQGNRGVIRGFLSGWKNWLQKGIPGISVSSARKENTATHPPKMVAVFVDSIYAALSGLRCLVFQPYTAATYG